MVSPAMLIVALVIAIAIILFCIIVLKLNASIGMVLASLFMGVAGGLDLMTTMDTISSGFGSMMTSIGLAEVTTRRLFNKMKLEMTYPTGVTNTCLHLMKIPMIMDNDREALQLALMCCPEAEDHDHMKMIRIPNTAHIGVIEISEGMLPLVENNPNFEVLTEPYDLPFDENGNLF